MKKVLSMQLLISCINDLSATEAMGIRLAFKVCFEYALLIPDCGVYALVVASALKDKYTLPISIFGSVIKERKLLEPCFHNILYTHVGRSGNQAAHGLAKHALTHLDRIC